MNKRIETRVCGECGKEFEYDAMEYFVQNKPFPGYCSQGCRNAAVQKVRQDQIQRSIPPKLQNLVTEKQAFLNEVRGKSLFLCGGVGTGKTVFIGTLAKEYILSGKKIKWISYPQFVLEIQDTYSREHPDKTAYDLAKEAAHFEGWLFIDDLGAEKLTEFVRQITYYLMNEREMRKLETVITSNFSLEEIDRLIDRRISSRIAGICEVKRLGGSDKRLVKKGSKPEGS